MNLDTLKNLLDINPYQDSLDKNLNTINKKGYLKRLGSWIIHLLTFGFRSLNPDLNQATEKAIKCANEFLNTQSTVTQQKQSELLAAFNNLRIVILTNQGAMLSDVEKVMKRVNEATATRWPKTAISSKLVFHSPANQKLLELLNSYNNEKWNVFKNPDFNKMEHLQKEILLLLPDVVFFRSKYDEELCTILFNIDNDSFKELFPKLKPEFIINLVNLLLNRRKTFFMGNTSHLLLQKFAEQLPRLPKDHPNLLAFVNAFPLEQELPQSFEYRDMIINCYNIARLLVSDAFKELINHVAETERSYLFNNLPSYAGRALEESWDIQQKQLNQALIALPNSFPNYRELILKGLDKSKDFAILESFQGNDAKIITSVWAQDLPRCYDNFLQHPSKFDHPAGREIIKLLLASPERREAIFENDDTLIASSIILSEEIAKLISHDKWKQAKECFCNAHSKLKAYFNTCVLGYKAEEMAEEWVGDKLINYIAVADNKESRQWLFDTFESRGNDEKFLQAVSKFPLAFFKDVCTPFGFFLSEDFRDQKNMREILSKIDPTFDSYFEDNGNVKLEKAKKINWLYGQIEGQDLINMLAQEELEPLSLAPLFNDVQTSDLTLIIEGKEIKAHQCVLAGALHLFKASTQFKKENRIEIFNFSYDQVLTVIQAVYEGKFPDFEETSDEEAFLEVFTYFNGGKAQLGS